MTNLRSILMAGAASLIVVTGAQAADRPLSGTITSASGQKLEGVTVSAKQEGSTITTSVYTDGTGTYYFPLLPSGRYQVWAQALGFERARSSVDLSAGRRQDLVLQPITDPERRIRQLPSELLVAALPEGTEDDARMKRVFMNNCTGCHAPGYVLQFRFDQAGWSKVIDLMKVVPVTGVYPGPNTKANKILDHNQQELAAYLSRARGPAETSMKFVAASAARRAKRRAPCGRSTISRSIRTPASGPSTTTTTAPTGRWAPPPSSARCRTTEAWGWTARSTSP